ncbi:MAG: hypothetical protein AAB259_03765, partial [Pseudomonadota bacterium]
LVALGGAKCANAGGRNHWESSSAYKGDGAGDGDITHAGRDEFGMCADSRPQALKESFKDGQLVGQRSEARVL